MDPPKLARFLIGRLPGSRQKLLVICLSSTTQNRSGVVVPLEIGRTEARWTSDDNFVALHHYTVRESAWLLSKSNFRYAQAAHVVFQGEDRTWLTSGTDEHS